MTVESARAQYAAVARAIAWGQRDHLAGRMPEPVEQCGSCHGNSLMADDASIDLDLAMSAQHDVVVSPLLRALVVWAKASAAKAGIAWA